MFVVLLIVLSLLIKLDSNHRKSTSKIRERLAKSLLTDKCYYNWSNSYKHDFTFSDQISKSTLVSYYILNIQDCHEMMSCSILKPHGKNSS